MLADSQSVSSTLVRLSITFIRYTLSTVLTLCIECILMFYLLDQIVQFSIDRILVHMSVVVWVDQHSYSASDPVNTWMGDHLRVGKPSWCVTIHLSQLSLPSLWGR